jgi:type I restriction enzyme S subunit
MVKEGWEERKLNEISLNITDGTHSTVKNDLQGEYYLLSCKNIKNGEVIINKRDRKINKGVFDMLKKRTKLERGDILITTVGTIGEVAMINSGKINFDFQRSVGIIKPNKKVISPYFLRYFMDSPDYQGRIRGLSRGVAQQCLFLNPLGESKVKYPTDILLQNKIAAILHNYTCLIKNNEKRIKLLETIAKRIYEEWFVNFRFPGYEKIKMIDSKTDFGIVPEEWMSEQIGNKFEVVLGGTPARAKPEYWGGNINWINSGKVNKLRIIDGSEKITDLGLKKSSTKMMPLRTTVLAITGATLGQISLTEKEVCANQSVVGVYDKNNLYSEFLYLKIAEIIKKIILKAGGGAQQHINKENVSETEIVIPDKEIIMRFNRVIRPLFDLLANLMIKNQNLRKTRDLLLPKLISGEVDVSKLNIKIPEMEV